MSTKKRTPIQEAVVALRKRLQLTQQQLAVAMNVTVVTVCRWETSRPPSGLSLLQLDGFARGSGANEIAETFKAAISEECPRQYIVTRLPERAGEAALTELRAYKDVPCIDREYRKALRALERAHRRLIEEARANIRTGGSGLMAYMQDLQGQRKPQAIRTHARRLETGVGR